MIEYFTELPQEGKPKVIHVQFVRVGSCSEAVAMGRELERDRFMEKRRAI